MLTIFSTPKPFVGHIDIIQRNAINSWVRLHPNVEVLLLGNDAGVAEAAQTIGARHVPEIACNEYGTPLISDIFAQGEALATHSLLCYCNADIILMRDFITALKQVSTRFDKFLMVGRRLDLNITQLLTFDNGWEEELREKIKQSAVLHGPAGIDFFAFPRDIVFDMPPFAVGRPRWDNWLIYRTRELGLPVVDVTIMVTTVHQNHDYSHVPQRTGHKWLGPEAEQNQALAHAHMYVFNLNIADWRLTEQGIERVKDFRYYRQRLNAWLTINHPILRDRASTLWRRVIGSI